jgi:hypothetical protein
MLTRTSTIKFPFLALSRRTATGSVPEECSSTGDCALAFTSLVDAEVYLQEHRASDLVLELITRQNFVQYLDALEQAGFVGVGFNGTNVVPMVDLRLTL